MAVTDERINSGIFARRKINPSPLFDGNGGNDQLFGGAGDDQLYGEASDTPVDKQGDDYPDSGVSLMIKNSARCAVLFNEAANDSNYQSLLERTAA